MKPVQYIESKIYQNKFFYDNSWNEKPPIGKFCSWDIIECCDDYEFLQPYCKTENILDVCPPELYFKYQFCRDRVKKFLISAQEAKVNFNNSCLYDTIPREILKDLLIIKNKICDYIFEKYKKPHNYSFLYELKQMCLDIKQNKINVLGCKTKPYIKYNIFNHKTGRLTTANGYFPILSYKKEDRINIFPNNDYFLEIDYNAFDIRTLFKLFEEKKYDDVDDVYTYFSNIIGGGGRDEIKKKFFSILYGKNEKKQELHQIIDFDWLKKKYYDNGKINGPFDTIVGDDEHFVNYLVSSTSSAVFLRRAININKYLKKIKAKSKICFLIHDAIVIDFCNEEEHIINNIKKIFESTELGKYKSTIKVGKTFGTMEKKVV